jgi:hypothetical protein
MWNRSQRDATARCDPPNTVKPAGKSSLDLIFSERMVNALVNGRVMASNQRVADAVDY